MHWIENLPSGSSFRSRLEIAFEVHGQLCVGLDPSLQALESWGLPLSAAGAERFCNEIVDLCAGQVGVVKPQVAFFEQFGSNGFFVLERLLLRARDAGLLVIADAKRGDIGTTMEGYSTAWLSSEAPFYADALTLSPFLGPESLTSSISLATSNGKGVFLLAATSNHEARDLQTSIGGSGESVSAQIAKFVSAVNRSHLGSIGLVIGADTELGVMGLSADILEGTPILAPGYGAQGAKLSDLRNRFGAASGSVICSASRLIAGDSPEGLSNRIRLAKNELERGLESLPENS